MNPVKQIGRYLLPILSVTAIRERRGILAWVWPGFDVYLTNGSRLRFTREEKAAYDKALEEHEIVMQVYGMCRGAGLRA